MSHPPSASSSLAPSRSQTPLPPTANVQSASHHLHTTTLTHKLKHMFDSPRHATFAAQVVIHELSNIPQLDGEFAVQWKFRGKRPKQDALRHPVEQARVPPSGLAGIAPRNGSGPHLHTKSSLPNLRLQQPSTSSVSLRSTSTASTTSTVPPPSIQPRSLLPPAHANSLRQSSMPSNPSATSVPSLRSRADKKPSDPTPLRNSVGPDDSQTQLIMEEPEEMEAGLGAVDEPASSTTSSVALLQGESSSGSSRNSLDSPRPTARFAALDGNRTPSAAASTGHLGVPFPKRTTTLPPARSGTTPSPSIITGSVPGTTDVDLRLTRSRTLSRASSRSAGQASSALLLNDARPRSVTSSSTGIAPLTRTPTHTAKSSVHRKGVTPPSALRLHTVAFEFEVQHVIKVPLGKPVPLSGTATPSSSRPREPSPRKHGTAPILGAGPMSDSGLKLTILQVHKAGKEDASGDESRRSEAARERERAKEREDLKSVYGWVDIDLAPFAGLGPTTRKFLLRNSKTNATIRITVQMHWVGGEERWAAPPLHDGHHATGIKDLTGTEASDNVRSDLVQLHQSPSRSSGSDLSSLSAQASTSNVSGRSGPSPAPSNNLSRNQSAISLVPPGPQQLGYKTYEHHLKEEPKSNGKANLHTYLTIPLGSRARSPSPSALSSTAGLSPGRSMSPGFSPGHSRRPSHRHHTHHMRDSTHHLHGRDPETEAHGHELPPEFVIEAIFNPRPAEMETPFTYLPQGSGSPLFGGGTDVFGATAGQEARGRPSGPLGAIEEPPSPHEGERDEQTAAQARRGWGKLRKRVASGKERSYVGRVGRVGGDD
ncbi:hypothetical protein Q5752_004221 [Cryptotrichosporon argae]